MTLVINKLFLYEEKDSIIKFGNVKKSLEGVNKWNYRHLMRLPAGTNQEITYYATIKFMQLWNLVFLCTSSIMTNKYRQKKICRSA